MDKTLTVILALLVPLGWGLLSAWAFDRLRLRRSCPPTGTTTASEEEG
ncbi:MAG TPA: hypothetical protein GX702_10430 [Chloroflexi bacterium]|jgi:hypothetical protein|nr:hypothetical protein [Chloroflexota bacterium]